MAEHRSGRGDEGVVPGPPVTYRLDDGVVTIAMDDGKVNALSMTMFAALDAALDRSLADRAATVITGRGSVFSGGFDLATMRASRAQRRELVERGFRFALRLLEHPRPVVIACNGHAIAMGAIALLCADYRVGAAGEFKVMTNEVAIGMTMPFAGLEICRFRLAPTHLYRAVTLAEAFSPSGAVTAGFLDHVVEPPTVLLASCREKAAELGALDEAAYQEVKRRTRAVAVRAIRDADDRDREIFLKSGS